MKVLTAIDVPRTVWTWVNQKLLTGSTNLHAENGPVVWRGWSKPNGVMMLIRQNQILMNISCKDNMKQPNIDMTLCVTRLGSPSGSLFELFAFMAKNSPDIDRVIDQLETRSCIGRMSQPTSSTLQPHSIKDNFRSRLLGVRLSTSPVLLSFSFIFVAFSPAFCLHEFLCK